MAVLYVTEYRRLGREAHGGPGNNIQSPLEPSTKTQTIAIGATSAQCAVAFDAETTIVELHTDAICSYKFGKDPTAKTTDHRMAANGSKFFCVEPNSGLKVAVISNT